MNETALVVTSEEQRRVDRRAEAAGTPSIQLMESAGNAAAAILEARFHPQRTVIIAGRGGNGGDAFVVARAFRRRGLAVVVHHFAPPGNLTGATRQAADALLGEAPDAVVAPSSVARLDNALRDAELIIDGLYGSGLARPLSAADASIVRRINAAAAPTASLDVPSGLSADTGRLIGPAVAATATVAMQFLKPVHLERPGRALCGEVLVAPVAYGSDILAEVRALGRVLLPAGARSWLPHRAANGHKGTFGRVLVVAGSAGLSGAAILCCRGALRAGAGLVFLAAPRSLSPVLEISLPEAINIPLTDRGGRITPRATRHLRTAMRQADVLAIGPGLSRGEGVFRVVRSVVRAASVPVVIDADALLAFRAQRDLLRGGSFPRVLTPHPGELSRLLDRSVEEIAIQRAELARQIAKDLGVTLLLKGHPTAVAWESGEVYLNPTGNTALGTGGSGDLLTGIIAGLIAGGAVPSRAAVLAAYVHGLAADRLAAGQAERSILPTDLDRELPATFRQVESPAAGPRQEEAPT